MKKVLSFVLVCLLAVSAFSTLAVADDNFNATGYPIAKEPVTYSALVSQSSNYANDYNEYEVIKYQSELTNIYFEWEYVSATDWATQSNLKLAAGDIPDMIYAALDTTQLQTYGVEGGMFLNFYDYIDEYMPNLKQALADDPGMGQYATMLDGGMYALPRIVWTYTMGTPWVYRGDWLNEYNGGVVPTTVDEFYDALVKVKEAKADVEGFYPIIATPASVENWLFPAFGDAWQVGYADNGDGKVVNNHVSDQWRRFLEYANKLYTEGLLNPEMYTMDTATIKAQIKDGKAFVMGNSQTALTAEYYASGTNETQGLDPLVSQWTDTKKTLQFNAYGYGGRTINADCENPEYLMRFLDMFFQARGTEEANVCGISTWLGTQGEHWDISEDGKYYYRILPEDTFGLIEEDYKNKYIIDSTYCGLVVLDLIPMNNPTQEFWANANITNYYPFMQPNLMHASFKYTDDESSELVGMEGDLNTYISTATAQFITGVTELNDATWQNYVDTVNGMGLERILELKQIGYDRWNGEA